MNSPKFSQDPDQSFGGESRSSVAQAARDTASKVGAAASETASKVKQAASETASKMKQSAEKLVTDHKQSAADRVGAYSSAIHESAKSLEQQDPNIAWLTHRAADRLESVANYVRTRDFRGLRKDAEDLARRHPAAFFGGMCVAGLVLGSVIRAARQASSSNGGESMSGSGDNPTGAGSESERANDNSSYIGNRDVSLEDIPNQGASSAEI
ncbi:MAG: hypothetical protein ABIZ04_13220 [Opitutus sp.]